MDKLPNDVIRHIHSCIDDEVSRIAYEATCRSIRNSADTSYRKMIYDHVNAILPSCADSTMGFLAKTKACIVGPAALKSIALVSSYHGSPIRCDLNVAVDFYIPYDHATKTWKETEMADMIFRYFGHSVQLVSGPDIEMRCIMIANVRAAFISSSNQDQDPLQKRSTLRFIFLKKDASVPNMVKSIDLRGLQFALGFHHQWSIRPLEHQMDFIRLCDMSDGEIAAEDVMAHQLFASNYALKHMTLISGLDLLDIFIKYVWDYVWTITLESMDIVNARYAALIHESRPMDQIYYGAIWNSLASLYLRAFDSF